MPQCHDINDAFPPRGLHRASRGAAFSPSPCGPRPSYPTSTGSKPLSLPNRTECVTTKFFRQRSSNRIRAAIIIHRYPTRILANVREARDAGHPINYTSRLLSPWRGNLYYRSPCGDSRFTCFLLDYPKGARSSNLTIYTMLLPVVVIIALSTIPTNFARRKWNVQCRLLRAFGRLCFSTLQPSVETLLAILYRPIIDIFGPKGFDFMLQVMSRYATARITNMIDVEYNLYDANTHRASITVGDSGKFYMRDRVPRPPSSARTATIPMQTT